MYGPPRDCKNKVDDEKVCVNVSGLYMGNALALMSMRAHLPHNRCGLNGPVFSTGLGDAG